MSGNRARPGDVPASYYYLRVVARAVARDRRCRCAEGRGCARHEALMRSGLQQIREYAGWSPERPLAGLGSRGLRRLLARLDLEGVRLRTLPGRDGTRLEVVEARHAMTGLRITLFNRIERRAERGGA